MYRVLEIARLCFAHLAYKWAYREARVVSFPAYLRLEASRYAYLPSGGSRADSQIEEQMENSARIPQLKARSKDPLVQPVFAQPWSGVACLTEALPGLTL